LPDGCFQTKNPNLGKFWRVLEWKMLVYFMAIWNILPSFGIFYDHLEYCTIIWYILRPFGNVVVICYIFPHFGTYNVSRKIWQPWSEWVDWLQVKGKPVFCNRFNYFEQLQGCQMLHFQTKNPNLGTFWWVLQWKMLEYFIFIRYILQQFGIFYGHLVYFLVICNVFQFWHVSSKKDLATLSSCHCHVWKCDMCWKYGKFKNECFAKKDQTSSTSKSAHSPVWLSCKNVNFCY
jgi:hypothetical protein